MLTFLRKIRKSLIDLGSTRKYLLYAIGEIALVVIGILIALQINNWNENQKSVRVENELVKALTTEIKENKRYISNYANRYLARVDSIGKIMLNNFGQKSNLMSADTFDIYLENLVTANYSPRTAKFDQVINGEDISYIKNDSLRILLANYKSLMVHIEINSQNYHDNLGKIQEYLNYNYTRRNTIHNSTKVRYSKINTIGRSAFDHSHVQLLQDPYFENLLAERIVLCTYVQNRMAQLLRNIELLLKFIDDNYGPAS